MEMSVLQTLGLLASITVGALGIIKWLLSRIDSVSSAVKSSLEPQIASLTAKCDLMTAAISDVRVNYANKQELTAVVQMFQNSMDRQSAESSRAIDGITSRIDNLINIVTRQHNAQ